MQKGFTKALCIIMGWAFVVVMPVGALAQSGSNRVASQLAAAKALTDDTWLILYSEVCGVALGAGGRAASAAPPPVAEPGVPAGQVPRQLWYHEPVKVFDNLYVFQANDVNAWAIKTSDGIILIDSTYDYMVKDLIADGLQKVGLDPKQIKYLILTHGHGDHTAGARYLQDTFGPHVLMSEADWPLVAQSQPTGPFANMPVPKKDMVATDGQKLTLGDTTITMYITPGHTAGTISLIIPVKDKGVPHTAVFWGGTALGAGPNTLKYAESARRFQDIAAAAGADVILSNHGRYIDLDKRIGANRANPGGPNAFILNATKVRQFLEVADHCAQAIALAQPQRGQQQGRGQGRGGNQ